MVPLGAALAAPVLGALFYGALHDRPAATRLVDGLVYLAVPILVALQVFPQTLNAEELLNVVAAGVGAGLYFVLERMSRVLSAQADNLAILVALSGLVLHAFLEGAALAPGTDSDAFFVHAVVLHRFPIGFVIWWLIRPRHGMMAASIGIGVVVVATLAGALGGGGVSLAEDGMGVELYQAFVAGSLLHVVFHQGRSDHRHYDHGV